MQSHRFKVPSDGAPISPIQRSFGTPGQTKVSGDHQRETTHEICCLAAELSLKAESLLKLRFYHHFYDGKKPQLSHFLMTIKIILLNPYLLMSVILFVEEKIFANLSNENEQL